MAVALIRALGPGQLAVEPSPTGLTVALSVHADAVVGTRRVQAIHCIKSQKKKKIQQRLKKKEQTDEEKPRQAAKSHTRVDYKMSYQRKGLNEARI